METGLPLLAEAGSAGAWRAGEGLTPIAGAVPYSWREYVRERVRRSRAQHHGAADLRVDGDMPFHDHKGFNWTALRERLARRFVIDDTVASPIPRLGPHLATQVWFVAHRKPV